MCVRLTRVYKHEEVTLTSSAPPGARRSTRGTRGEPEPEPDRSRRSLPDRTLPELQLRQPAQQNLRCRNVHLKNTAVYLCSSEFILFILKEMNCFIFLYF